MISVLSQKEFTAEYARRTQKKITLKRKVSQIYAIPGERDHIAFALENHYARTHIYGDEGSPMRVNVHIPDGLGCKAKEMAHDEGLSIVSSHRQSSRRVSETEAEKDRG